MRQLEKLKPKSLFTLRRFWPGPVDFGVWDPVAKASTAAVIQVF